MQAGGLAAQSVDVLITRCTHDPLQEDGNGSPVRSLLSPRHAGYPLLGVPVALQDATGLGNGWIATRLAGHLLRSCCNGSNATNRHEKCGLDAAAMVTLAGHRLLLSPVDALNLGLV